MAEGPRLTPTPTPNDAITTGVPSDRLWLRSELMGTQVITRDTGRRLGVVGEVIVDIDRREVVAVGLRDNPLTRFLPGLSCGFFYCDQRSDKSLWHRLATDRKIIDCPLGLRAI